MLASERIENKVTLLFTHKTDVKKWKQRFASPISPTSTAVIITITALKTLNKSLFPTQLSWH